MIICTWRQQWEQENYHILVIQKGLSRLVWLWTMVLSTYKPVADSLNLFIATLEPSVISSKRPRPTHYWRVYELSRLVAKQWPPFYHSTFIILPCNSWMIMLWRVEFSKCPDVVHLLHFDWDSVTRCSQSLVTQALLSISNLRREKDKTIHCEASEVFTSHKPMTLWLCLLPTECWENFQIFDEGGTKYLV